MIHTRGISSCPRRLPLFLLLSSNKQFLPAADNAPMEHPWAAQPVPLNVRASYYHAIVLPSQETARDPPVKNQASL
jgi:hypothetical protein